MPIYPGTYLVETMGQLSLCLYYFARNVTTTVSQDATPAPVRATKILGAHFLAPVGPGATVTIEARGIDDDGFFAHAAAQAIVDERIVCVSVGEVCFV
jgi:3-hydroxymyristoyl/3-hydroxydecanoyl-(acyl carrier protein) dehydratase